MPVSSAEQQNDRCAVWPRQAQADITFAGDGYSDFSDMPSPEDHAKVVDAAYRYSPNAITPFLLKQVEALKIDDNDVLLDWCTECHIDLSDVTLDW